MWFVQAGADEAPLFEGERPNHAYQACRQLLQRWSSFKMRGKRCGMISTFWLAIWHMHTHKHTCHVYHATLTGQINRKRCNEEQLIAIRPKDHITACLAILERVTTSVQRFCSARSWLCSDYKMTMLILSSLFIISELYRHRHYYILEFLWW